MPGWICGSTFFVRASPVTVDFFKKVALIMTRRQSPDSSIMTYLCGAPCYKCAKLPRWVISSSNFFMGNRNVTPVIIQLASYCVELVRMNLDLCVLQSSQ
ncbi:hypothetical protein OESDEN_23980 [Oesophagostomum dentatum]|uniref:Nucleotide-diphospho-sugar transferase domain-containing protein n=1 Tax=Oesophagostomum dentatum TaxID=61180 RepID=A0A0B1RZJ4_OESDE|nr:hypothetical protein OESDEN_23980 [Oesophagostomum dentatum]